MSDSVVIAFCLLVLAWTVAGAVIAKRCPECGERAARNVGSSGYAKCKLCGHFWRFLP